MNIGAVLLAAGASHRFGTENKLLANIGGKPLIRWVAEEITHSGAAEVVVVTGCDHLLIENAQKRAQAVSRAQSLGLLGTS